MKRRPIDPELARELIEIAREFLLGIASLTVLSLAQLFRGAAHPIGDLVALKRPRGIR